MELIPYEQFAKLRLRDFVPDHASITESTGWEWMGTTWLNESIGFTSFSRHEATPQDTGGLEVSVPELHQDAVQQVFRSIGLPLHAGMGHDEVLSALGQPTATHRFVPGRRTYDLTLGSTQPYLVGCTFEDTKGLIHVSVVRSDLISEDAA